MNDTKNNAVSACEGAAPNTEAPSDAVADASFEATAAESSNASAVQITRHGAHAFLFPYTRAEIRAALHTMLVALGLPYAGLELIISNDEEVAEYNRDYLGCLGTTNILSFPAEEACAPTLVTGGAEELFPAFADPSFPLAPSFQDDMPVADFYAAGSPYLGTLLLSVEQCRRESFLYGQDIRAHALRLIAHGLLHLMGYDHGELMESQTELALSAVAQKK